VRISEIGYTILKRAGISAVLNLSEEISDNEAWLQNHDIVYLHIPIQDYTAPTSEQLKAGVTWIQEQVKDERCVYVHCHGGIGRSATMVAAYLMVTHGWNDMQAIEYLVEHRSVVDPTPVQRKALRAFSEKLVKRQSTARTGKKAQTSPS
jgi:atypical dual specificity phosphatase